MSWYFNGIQGTEWKSRCQKKLEGGLSGFLTEVCNTRAYLPSLSVRIFWAMGHFVDVEAHAVTESVAKVVAITGVCDEVAGEGVNVAAVGTGANAVYGGFLGT